jgi:hypothetical protein
LIAGTPGAFQGNDDENIVKRVGATPMGSRALLHRRSSMRTRFEDLTLKRATVGEELRQLHAAGDGGETFERKTRQLERIDAEIETLRARAVHLEQIAANTYRERAGTPTDEFLDELARDPISGRVMDDRQLGAMRMLDRNASAFSPKALDTQEDLVRRDSYHAREIEIHARPEYETAWWKVISLGEAAASIVLSENERHALAESHAARSARAQAEGSSALGGLAVPTMIDPTIILTDQESDDAFLRIARTIEVTTNSWKGVSSAGMSWSFDAEGSTVSDDGLYALVQPSVTISWHAAGFLSPWRSNKIGRASVPRSRASCRPAMTSCSSTSFRAVRDRENPVES